ncbi:TolC family protein [Sphingobacterium yanglingense]|uniref:Outer membrane protein TolC n=1 Tax=Sphingobacterium yanglingense TaxID=1437280 RepID=A0A4R6WPE1_9SPHI|nr:TolC family protein [Sphingobacterium yanglingense]TDQ80275.1 outer membrane protein TolC [Sphingobacterium yanglingense]
MINKLCACLLVIGTGLITNNVHGQVLEDYWQQTKANYKGFSIKDQEIGISRLDSASSLERYKPQVWLQYQQGLSSLNNVSGAFYPMPGIFNISGSNTSGGSSNTFNQYATSSVNWDLVNFGRKNLDKALGSTAIKQSTWEANQYTLLVQNELSQRYINYLYYQILSDWYHEHLKRYQDILELTRDLAISGIVPSADTLLVSSSLNNVQSELSHVSGQLKGGVYALSEFVGGAVNPAAQSVARFFVLLKAETGGDVLQPLLEIKKTETEKLDQLVKKSSKQVLPQIVGIGALSSRSSGVSSSGVASNNYGDMFQNYAHNYFVGVGMNWNLQQLFTAKSNRKIFEAKRSKVEEEYRLLDNELEQRLLDLSTQERQTAAGLVESDRSKQQASEAYEMYKVRYEGGLINLAELLQVQAILLQNEKQNLLQYYNYWNIVLKRAFLGANINPVIQHF